MQLFAFHPPGKGGPTWSIVVGQQPLIKNLVSDPLADNLGYQKAGAGILR